MSEISVIKATGVREPFSEEKVIRSIKRAGIPKNIQPQVLAHVREKLYPEIPTSEIYKHIMEFLGRSQYPNSRSRFSLKQAIMDLGPTGFPFEKFISAILRYHGYKTETDQIINGLCVAHEVDVLAEKDGQKIMIECKYHNRIGSRTDVKVALYVMARYQDLTAAYVNRDSSERFNEVWLVTNTKCSRDAIAYAQCMNMKIVSWGYPDRGNLQDLIEKDKLHPVTCLSTLSNYQKKLLLDNNAVLCRDLLANNIFIELLKLKPEEKSLLMSELREI